MAGICINYNGKSNAPVMEFVCDTVDEVADLPTVSSVGKGVFSEYDMCAPMGSTCLVGNDSGEILTYMLFSFGWKKI